MNPHAAIESATSAPTAKISGKRYRFKIGDMVDHRLGGMLSVITWRVRTIAGREMYGIMEMGGHQRVMLGEALVKV